MRNKAEIGIIGGSGFYEFFARPPKPEGRRWEKGKLPAKTICQEYKLEYATNTVEMHEDAIRKGQKVLLVDDVLATGGTMEATCQMVEKLGGHILGISFLIELDFLKGREKLKNYKVNSLLHYEK